MEETSTVKKVAVVLIFLVIIGGAIYMMYKNSLGNKTESPENNTPVVNDNVDIELDQATITKFVDEAFTENKAEVDSLGTDTKKIEKLLYGKVNKKCKGQASPSTIKSLISLYLDGKGY